MNKVQIKKQQIVERITQHLIVNGMSDVGLRTLAAVSGTSDRMLIYYFETKDNLLGIVMQAIADGLAAQLDAVVGEHKRPARQLIEELYALRDVPQLFAVIQLWFEVVGMAARGAEPYASMQCDRPELAQVGSRSFGRSKRGRGRSGFCRARGALSARFNRAHLESDCTGIVA